MVAFFVCWAPFHLQRLLYEYGDHDDLTFRIVNEYLYLLAGVAYYISATINPILYNVISVKYRTAFKETLCRISTPGGLSKSQSLKETTFSRANLRKSYSQYGDIYQNRSAFSNNCPRGLDLEMGALCRNHDETIDQIYRAQGTVTFHRHQHYLEGEKESVHIHSDINAIHSVGVSQTVAALDLSSAGKGHI